MKSRVPQGSVLGPLLFIIFISDIDKYLNFSVASSLVDDTSVLNKVTNQNDCKNLQNYLEKTFNWAVKSNMDFNSNKFELIRYIARNTPIDSECKTREIK